MGVYLSTPNTEKNSCDETCKKFTYGASSMQGWRMTQEDAHNCLPEFDQNGALFAVYDGHGGAEVAQYCAANLPQYIQELKSYKEGKYGEALEEAFLGFDALLTTPEVIRELKVLAGVESDDEGDLAKSMKQKKSEAEMLRQEADMPIEELMAKYEYEDSAQQPRTRILRKKGQVNSPVIKPKKLPYPTDASKLSMNINENANLDAKEEDKVSNGHAENENNINLEKESQMSSASSSVQQDVVSSSVDASSTSSSQNVASISSSSSSSSQKVEAGSSKDIVDSSKSSAGSASSSQAGSSNDMLCSSQSGGTRSGNAESSGVTSADSVEGSSNIGTKNSEVTDGASSSSTSEAACGSSSDMVGGSSSDMIGGSSAKPAAGSSLVCSGSSDTKKDNDDESGEDEEEIVVEEIGGSDEEDDEDYEMGAGSDDDDDDEEDSDDDDIDEEVDHGGGMMNEMTEEPGSDSGSTAVLALMKDKQIYVANAGDSRCILSRGGKAVDLSADHKPEDDSERTRIEAAGGKVTEEGRVNGGLNLSRALGDHFYKRNTDKSAKEQMITALPDIETATLQENDEFMVLACDGIWNYMTSQEVVDFVKEKLKEEENRKKISLICEQLFDKCLAPNTLGDGTGCDNMTCIIVIFDQILNNNKNKRPAEDCVDSSDKRQRTDEPVT